MTKNDTLQLGITGAVKRTGTMWLKGAALLVLAGMMAGCARQAPEKLFSASASAAMKSDLPRGEARRQAIQQAETRARDQVLVQAAQIRLPSGQPLAELAVTDPFIRSALQDCVRAAQVKDRSFDDQGNVTVTITMQQAPLDKMLEGYVPPTVKK